MYYPSNNFGFLAKVPASILSCGRPPGHGGLHTQLSRVLVGMVVAAAAQGGFLSGGGCLVHQPCSTQALLDSSHPLDLF